jgi:hypothetical protein
MEILRVREVDVIGPKPAKASHVANATTRQA